ncbi:radical SAM protein [Hydrogenimonas thermophila]|uniref:Wyosine [tRNA(Phe)-imidazoG37] synthetase, radical SAM superfamily n=1 Tax=Hydrogenimonas thermophila TaxID=223786 RepID=A0A1I5RIL6_9BACT|nr:radical SAM protein [Hydrogenimonas thermophila]SFP58439.1 Wyosine [tRNA(Phe)-imidazoG37] synthetase, radical SAM superfamily [Hydrogenimonas thermophila]
MKTIFGPVPSRRFGKSLGIDLSPEKKQCNYDCLYCELAAAKQVNSIENPPSVDMVISELKTALKKYPDVDVITITANGEPTLYPYLDELIDEIDAIKGNYKTLILTNSSTITNPKVQKTLAKLDTVKLSLDCVTPEAFKKLDRPLKSITIQSIIDGIIEFRTIYNKELILEILMVKGINTTDKEIEAFNQVLPNIDADRIDIGSVDRPPAYPIEPLSYAELIEISKKFSSSLPIHITSRHKAKDAKGSFSDEEILSTLQKRPLTMDDIKTLFDEDSFNRFQSLLDSKKIEEKILGTLKFYSTANL